MKIAQVKSFYIAGREVKKIYSNGRVIWEKLSVLDGIHQLTVSGTGNNVSFTLKEDISVSALDQNGTFDLWVDVIDRDGNQATVEYHQLPNTIFMNQMKMYFQRSKPEIAPLIQLVFAGNQNGSFFFRPIPRRFKEVIGARVKFNN